MRAIWRLGLLIMLVPAGPVSGQTAMEGPPPVDLPALIAECEGCHGPGGVSDQDGIPSLAGKDAGTIIAALEAFYFYERHCPTLEPPHADGPASPNNMCSIASSLSDEEAEQLAGYFAARPPPGE